jgi:hypothetical protein
VDTMKTKTMTALPYGYAPLSYEWATGHNATDVVYVHQRIFQQFAARMDVDGGGFICELLFDGCPFGKYSTPIRIGGYHNEEPDIIYTPDWMIEAAGIGLGDANNVTISTYEEEIVEATYVEIVLMDVGAAIYSTDTKEMFEMALGAYGCIKKESTVKLHLEGFDMTVEGFVADVKPANIVRFNGEVEVNIIVGQDDPVPSAPVADPHPHSHPHAIAVTPPPVEPEVEEVSVEDRRAAVRASWLARFSKS